MQPGTLYSDGPPVVHTCAMRGTQYKPHSWGATPQHRLSETSLKEERERAVAAVG